MTHSASMLPPLRFGECEVHPRQRELRLRGQLQPVAPKVFDLLLMLLQQRHRAVPKAELAAALWQREEVSDSVLARTLMQARKLIGDAAEQQLWIKTIHGYGYRFVGEVFEAGADALCAPAPDPSTPGAARRAGRLRLGVLPCENQTGDRAIEWTQLGLMALVGHALEADARLDVVTMQTMLEALGRLPPEALMHEKAQLALHALGLDWVIQATIRRQGSALWLDYQRVGIDGRSQGGSLRENDPVVMGQRFAQAVSDNLFPGQGAALEFLSRDPFVNQAFARAIELWSQQQLQSAATLFDMVCDREPGSLAAQLWRFRVLTLLCRPDAQALGQSLLKLAAERGEWRTLVITHIVSGQAAHLASGSPEAAVGHYRQAQQLLEGRPPSDLSGLVAMHLGIDAHARHQLPEALRLYTLAETEFRAAAYPFHLGHVALHIAMLEELSGNLMAAQQRFDDALVLLRRHRLPAHEAVALAGLADLNMGLGLRERAWTQAEAAAAQLAALQSPQAVAMGTAALCVVFGECGALRQIDQLMAVLDLRLPGEMGPRIEGPRAQSAILAALWHGDLARMRSIVQKQCSAGGNNPNALLMLYMHLLRAESAAGCFAQAAELRERLAGLPLADVYLESRGAVGRSIAAERLCNDDPLGALAWLSDVINEVPFGREHARARIDSAWLHAAFGNADRAASLLLGADAWRTEHPAGLAAQARLLYTQHQYDAALAAQRLALQHFRGPVPPVHQQLLQAYAEASRNGEAVPLPRLGGLATDSWLPPLNA